jgi:2-oxoglutarate ferredoxin oxidoreductase subunit alpha
MRGGPGLGTIQPGQGDYFQATRGGGNGDYRTVVLAPSNVQETADFVQEAFDIADQYRTPVVVLADGLIGQMMEPIEWHPVPRRQLPAKDWAACGKKGRSRTNVINSLFLNPEECDALNRRLTAKYAEIEQNEVRWDTAFCEDAEVLITAYGTPARIALTALELLREEGVKAGLFRPVTLWPFPEKALRNLADEAHVKVILDVEMSSTGQMLDDVRLAVEGRKPVRYLGRAGGLLPTVEEIIESAKTAWKEAQ